METSGGGSYRKPKTINATVGPVRIKEFVITETM
jgi:hypothetical protein